MKKYLVSFATPMFYLRQKELVKSAKKYGIDNICSFNRKHISKDFFNENKEILNLKRGAGYWLWKPYFILKCLEKMDEGDALIYLDSDHVITNKLDNLINLCKKNKGVLLFKREQINKNWTKRDCFILMKSDSKKYWEAEQVQAGFQIYIKNNFSINFVKKWLDYCKNKLILTDCPNSLGFPDFPDFREHRHDQSVLSILSVKHNIKKVSFYESLERGENNRKIILLQKEGILAKLDRSIGKLGVVLRKLLKRSKK